MFWFQDTRRHIFFLSSTCFLHLMTYWRVPIIAQHGHMTPKLSSSQKECSDNQHKVSSTKIYISIYVHWLAAPPVHLTPLHRRRPRAPRAEPPAQPPPCRSAARLPLAPATRTAPPRTFPCFIIIVKELFLAYFRYWEPVNGRSTARWTTPDKM